MKKYNVGLIIIILFGYMFLTNIVRNLSRNIDWEDITSMFKTKEIEYAKLIDGDFSPKMKPDDFRLVEIHITPEYFRSHFNRQLSSKVKHEASNIFFKDHKDKWIIMVLASLSDGEHSNKLAQYLRDIKAYLDSDTELWLVRMDRPMAIWNQIPGFKTNEYCYDFISDKDFCFDRYVLGFLDSYNKKNLNYSNAVDWIRDNFADKIPGMANAWNNVEYHNIKYIAPLARLPILVVIDKNGYIRYRSNYGMNNSGNMVQTIRHIQGKPLIENLTKNIIDGHKIPGFVELRPHSLEKSTYEIMDLTKEVIQARTHFLKGMGTPPIQ